MFSASTDLLSAQRTSRFIGPVLRWFNPEVSDEAIRGVQFAVRKTAHVLEYAVLATLLWRARRGPAPSDRRPWCWRLAAFAWVGAFLFALTDEWHQSGVASRQGSLADVAVDAAGAALGLAFVWVWGRRRGHW